MSSNNPISILTQEEYLGKTPEYVKNLLPENACVKVRYPGIPYTQEYMPSRYSIYVGEDGLVESVRME